MGRGEKFTAAAESLHPHPGFERLLKATLTGLKGKQRSSNSASFASVSKCPWRVKGRTRWERRTEREGCCAPPCILSGQPFEPCPCLLLHYGGVTQGCVCSLNTINKVSPAHQYCYLHSVLICGPYNHKMLIAPINSQSVCALVWPPWALKVSVKMNCSLILHQEKGFFLSRDNAAFYSEIKRPFHPLSLLSFPESCS